MHFHIAFRFTPFHSRLQACIGVAVAELEGEEATLNNIKCALEARAGPGWSASLRWSTCPSIWSVYDLYSTGSRYRWLKAPTWTQKAPVLAQVR